MISDYVFIVTRKRTISRSTEVFSRFEIFSTIKKCWEYIDLDSTGLRNLDFMQTHFIENRAIEDLMLFGMIYSGIKIVGDVLISEYIIKPYKLDWVL